MTDIPARVLQVHDGDTLEVVVTVRLADCNARELTQPGGVEARDNLRTLLPTGTRVVLSALAPDHYRHRLDAQVRIGVAPYVIDVVEHLEAKQWVARYPGYGPKVNPPWPRTVD